MKWLSMVPTTALILSVFISRATGADLNGCIVVTKETAKKHVTVPVYQLRGASPTPAPQNSEPATPASDVVVFLEAHAADAARPVRAKLQQRGQRFEPQLLVVPAGSTVSFPNTDPIFHNVFSLSGTKKFDLGYYPAGQTRTVRFDEPGVVQVYCHLHPNMYAAIVIVPNRWYTQPADDGTFKLHDVPPGSYRLVAWHISAGYFRRNVEVSAMPGSDVIVDIPVHDGERDR
jgi:plastocyanin